MTAVAIAGLTAIVAFTSSDVRPGRVRLAAVVAVAAGLAAIIAERIPSERLLGVAQRLAGLVVGLDDQAVGALVGHEMPIHLHPQLDHAGGGAAPPRPRTAP